MLPTARYWDIDMIMISTDNCMSRCLLLCSSSSSWNGWFERVVIMWNRAKISHMSEKIYSEKINNTAIVFFGLWPPLPGSLHSTLHIYSFLILNYRLNIPHLPFNNCHTNELIYGSWRAAIPCVVWVELSIYIKLKWT